jgi:hypothetical protein
MPRGRRDEDDITRPTKATVSGRAFLALQREAKTAGRTTADFGDIFTITGRLTFKAGDVRQALQAVAQYRHVELANLDAAVDGYAEIGQPRWIAWRRKLQ